MWVSCPIWLDARGQHGAVLQESARGEMNCIVAEDGPKSGGGGPWISRGCKDDWRRALPSGQWGAYYG